MDPNTALVDDFLARKASPPAANNNRGVHTPPSFPANNANANNNNGYKGNSSAPMMDANTLKRVFQLQQRLGVLLPEVAACINELQQYNMFPRMTNNLDSDPANDEAISILRVLLQSTSPDLAGTTTSSNNNNNNNNAGNFYTADPYGDSSSSSKANPSGTGDVFGALHNANNNGSNNNNNTNIANLTNPASNANADGYGMYGGFDAAAATTAAEFGSSNAIAFVEFKRSRFRKYVCEDPEIQPGSYVLVDGDRGTDCGLLVQMIHKLPDGQTSVVCMDGCDIKDEKVKLEAGRVIREATEDEVDRLHNTIASAEAVALKTCRQRCQELGIDIDLLDVEYQFDMKKIAFYFDCDHSVDFRSLVRELYRTFGARIWMENVNPKVKNAMPDRDNHHHDENRGGGGARGRGGYRQRRY